NPQAPGLIRAKELQIPTTHDVVNLITSQDAQLIVDVTGDPEVKTLTAQYKPPNSEVLGGAASQLLWNIVQHESQIQRQLAQTEKLAGIGTFASGIAHDINNPLYVILGFAETLLEETELEKIRDAAQEIILAAKRIHTICRDLTQYARSASPYSTTLVELNSKLDEALKIARYATMLQDLAVVKQYHPNPVICAKPEEILQVFVNLLTNAIQAMDGRGTLTLSTESRDGFVAVSIQDTGCGIPEDDLEKIFEPFFTTKPPGMGTGLGLHSVKSIVTKYHGHISVNSEVGKGTTFRIEFPRASQSEAG
ncbi:MAG: GHKL domain-containing protein, partial [Nitrospirae bacterium]